MCWISSNVPFFSTNNSSSCRRAFYINRANNGTINSTSSVAFSARSMERGNSGEGSPSICEVVNSSPNASVRVMFRQRSRRFFCSSEVDDENFIVGRNGYFCCSLRMVAFILMPILPVIVFLLTYFLIPTKQAREQDPFIRQKYNYYWGLKNMELFFPALLIRFLNKNLEQYLRIH